MKKQPSAVLVAIKLPRESDADVRDSLSELERLVTTLGYKTVGTLTQSRSSHKSPTGIGEGKLAELAKYTGGAGIVASAFKKKKTKAAEKFTEYDIESEDIDQLSEDKHYERADVVIFDCDLSPSQMRNLESAVGVPVLDRTAVIIEIFSRHAKTRAAQLQIEIARLNYTAPRMRETGGNQDRGSGGIGGKGAGESKVELDSRRIRDRIKELKGELASIQSEHQQRRERRKEENCVALVGYTNAGKSSLMRALTGSEVLVADKLFATLDTTVRPLLPEAKPRVLISDTVGFIKKLPHDLVASFKTTLDEALNADITLFVVDASDPAFRSHLQVTRDVLAEVGAGNIPCRLLLNKCDKLSVEEKAALKMEFSDALFLSARNKDDVKSLRDVIVTFFEKDMIEAELIIRHGTQKALGEVHNTMRVIREEYQNEGIHLTVRSTAESLARFKKRFKL